MKKLIKLKTIINKRNGQINVNIPKKKLSKPLLRDIERLKELELTLEDFGDD